MLQAARAWGVSPRRFLGWEPERTTVWQYSDAGRIGRTVETMEPEWSEEDRELALALAEYEALLCPGCGGDLEETTKKENEEGYEPLPALICWKCVEGQRLEKQKQKMREQRGDALLLNVRKKTGGVDLLAQVGHPTPQEPEQNLSERQPHEADLQP